MKSKDFNAIVQKLRRKFNLKEDGTDHVSYDIYFNDIWITNVKSSHSPKDWQDILIARNLHISKTDLKKFVQCTFSNEDLINKLKQKKYWPKKT